MISRFAQNETCWTLKLKAYLKISLIKYVSPSMQKNFSIQTELLNPAVRQPKACLPGRKRLRLDSSNHARFRKLRRTSKNMFDGNKSLTLKMVRMHGLKSQVWMVIVAQVAAAHIAKYTWSTCTSGRAGALYCIALFDLAKWSRKRAPSLYDASSLNIQLCGLDICQFRSVSQIANVLMFFFSLLAGPVTGVKRKLSQISLATYHKKMLKDKCKGETIKKGDESSWILVGTLIQYWFPFRK